MVAGFPLLSVEELQERRKINAKLENSLVYDARNARKMERGIVDNLCGLANCRGIETLFLDKLSQALQVIEEDRWKLKEENIKKISGFKRAFDEPAIAKGAKSEVSLRAPRTEIQVREAATKIQKRLTPKLL